MDVKQLEFELFRYQLLPVTQHAQADMFHKIRSSEDIRKNKNRFFFEVISELPKLYHRSIQLNQKIIVNSSPWLAFKLAAHKTLEREKEFKKERIENWPHVTVIINNEPDVQIIAVSKNSKAFSSGLVVAKLIKESLASHLLRYQLSMHVEAIFDRSEFWSIVEKYEGKISNVKFELISPNMANISKSLKLDLAQVNRDTNSHRTVLLLNSPEGAKLEIEKGNEMLESLVNYSADGGGDISFRIGGLRKRVHTSKSTRTLDTDELSVENLTVEQLEAFVAYLMKV